MAELGDRASGQTIAFTFTTSVNGVPTDLSGSPAISVYQSGNTTPITAGVTLTQTYNSTVGLNYVSIVASAGNAFASGQDYDVVITTGTLGGVSQVGLTVGHFSLNLANVASIQNTSLNTPDASGNVQADIAAVNGQANNAVALQYATGTMLRGQVGPGAGTPTSVPVSSLLIGDGGTLSGVVIAGQFVNRSIIFRATTTTAGLRGAEATITGVTISPLVFTVTTLPASPAANDVFVVS